MDLEVGRFALDWMSVGGRAWGGGVGRAFAYYAGKRRTLKAVASTAHCAIEGYISDMEAYPGRRRGVQWLAAVGEGLAIKS